MSALYLSRSDQREIDSDILVSISKQALRHTEQVFLGLTAHPDIAVVQISILLGSFCLFSGRRNTGFAVLGSGVKIAQVLTLHRDFKPSPSGKGPVVRNVQYVWWALEIFDKYGPRA